MAEIINFADYQNKAPPSSVAVAPTPTAPPPVKCEVPRPPAQPRGRYSERDLKNIATVVEWVYNRNICDEKQQEALAELYWLTQYLRGIKY